MPRFCQSAIAVPFLKHRIADRRRFHLIQKWLQAGVLEDGVRTVSDTGTGQGSVISPLLANVYLHDVFIFAFFVPTTVLSTMWPNQVLLRRNIFDG